MQLEDLNALDADAAARALQRCCGSTRWAREMTAARPFASAEAMTAKADAIWASLDPADWLEAFASHPRIGERSPSAWASEEQTQALTAPEAARARLAHANREYEARFGYIFIVCATGKGAAEILGLLERRLTNEPAAELTVAADEQRKITRLRLARLLEENR
ncbi:MAG: 2-oxo-4-hydroxy-4-carboxy-5-ureidoimidazoline decarboxylase [Acidobacteriia bacterium]|nr:2-oxo-4-hydroxy-4-carboxy-5-ureidoimidazoline decarboxylase [Terriglobia bacterium]